MIENKSVYAVCVEFGQCRPSRKAFNRRVHRDFAEAAEKTCNQNSYLQNRKEELDSVAHFFPEVELNLLFSAISALTLRTLRLKSFAVSRALMSDIIAAAIRIHRKLGPGLLESAYEACLSYELQKLGRRVERQKPVPLFYEDGKLDCGFRADIVVDNMVAVELKCKEAIHPVDEAQLLSHLRLLNLPIGLLINFHVLLLKDGIRRLVNNYAEPEDYVCADSTESRATVGEESV